MPQLFCPEWWHQHSKCCRHLPCLVWRVWVGQRAKLHELGCSKWWSMVDYSVGSARNRLSGGVLVGELMQCIQDQQKTTSADIAIVNFGVHYNNLGADFLSNVQSVIDWHARNEQSGKRPCTLWRESAPQHFPTPDGSFKSVFMQNLDVCSAGIANVTANGHFGCYPLPKKFREGRSRQKWNDAIVPLMSKSSIPIVPLFKTLLPMWDAHPACAWPAASKPARLDCTHFSSRSLFTFVNKLLIASASESCGL